MQIHKKPKIKIHKTVIMKHTPNARKKRYLLRGPGIKSVRIPVDVVYRYRMSRNGNVSQNMSHFPDTANPMKSEVGKQHHFTTAQSIGVFGGAIVTEQLEGGEELRDSSALAGMALHPFVETISAGKNMYQDKTQLLQLAKKIKKVDLDKRALHQKKSDYSKRRYNKKTVGASNNDNSKGLKVVGKRDTKPKIGRTEIKNSTRNRMLHFFVNKFEQNDKGDNIGAVMKDMVMMRVSVMVKHLAGYIGGLLLMLMLLIAIVSLIVMLVIAVIYNSPFAIFLPPLEEGDTVKSVTSSYIQEFNQEVSSLAYGHSGYDAGYVTYSGAATDTLNDVMVVYMVKYGIGETASVVNETMKRKLKDVFEDMYSFSASVEAVTIENEDETTTTHFILHVIVTKRTYVDMIPIYGFDEDEVQMLEKMMLPENLALLQ
ncbi:MAG: hypothetical protein K0R34_3103 [Herbinix sp.]|jgi:hypothetical protein|nr:hypothetical protein [Herbinix sp.]